jgi:hypothetical protein
MVFWRPDGQSFVLQAKYFQAGFTARPPEIGSTPCNTIFHVSLWTAGAKLFSTVVEYIPGHSTMHIARSTSL